MEGGYNAKKCIWIVCISAIVVLSVLYIVFWGQARAEQNRIEDLCQSSVSQSMENFKEYAAKGDDYLYMYGVAEFKSFMNAYLCLNDNADNPEYTYCNIIYGEMTLNPDKIQANIQKLIEALTILAEDYTDSNGYIRMNEFGNLLRYGEY